ncbi:uncharacterized protein LOC111691408 [Anoplophora glabripennis]|uniref:uncharacterized protein LOC111691408 n=1 Tax=Anoplophora glabripennis TaxID=217634 RepID=UPI000C76F5D5|nr:uncharacterized protein LOC111691408 [Anoplophora glabripennis]
MKSFTNIPSSINIICLLINICDVCAIWPPAYSVNLSHEETFVISEPLKDSDVQDVYDEEELIEKEDLAERRSMKSQNEKYFRIHRQVGRYNDKFGGEDGYNKDKIKVFEEYNPDVDDPVPWKAGFVDEHGKFKPDEGIIYFDGEPQRYFGNNKPKREEEAADKNDSVSYDYNSLKKEYEKNIKAAEKSNDTVRYSTVKEEESIKESVKAMFDFKKTPRNCTVEESKGIGLGAMECFWMEMKKPKIKNHVFAKAIRIIIIWVLLYVVIAVPCWCQYGWGCCCCRCKFCRPRENILEVQKFFAENPVGVYHDENGKVFNYKPTSYEKYAYKKLEQQLNKL